MIKVYVVELQSPYDGGHALKVFSTLTLAKEYCEKQEDFTKWDEIDPRWPEDMQEASKGDDYHYWISVHNLDEVE